MSMVSLRTQTTAAPLTAPSASSAANVCARLWRWQLLYLTKPAEPTARPTVAVFTLTTVPLVRKYASIFDALVTPTSDGQLLCVDSVRYAWNGATSVRRALGSPLLSAAMALHASQFVWYRRAFVLLSRYSLVNNLRRVS